MGTKYTSKLEGKRVLIIGGTSGIGFCVAECAIEHGAIVTVASSQQTSVEAAIARFTTSYVDAFERVQGHVIDFKSVDLDQEIVALLDYVTDNKKNLLDHIVETAGDMTPLLSLSQLTPATIFEVERVRLIGPVMLAKHAQPYLNTTNASSLTFTGGVNSYQPRQNWTLPALVGSAKDGLTRSLAVDLRPVRVNLVAPGAVYTELFTKAFAGDDIGLAAFQKSWTEINLTGSIGRPEDVAEAYIYCMKDKFVTGQVLLTDGGQTLGAGKQ